jgi:hypothetical protein
MHQQVNSKVLGERPPNRQLQFQQFHATFIRQSADPDVRVPGAGLVVFRQAIDFLGKKVAFKKKQNTSRWKIRAVRG